MPYSPVDQGISNLYSSTQEGQTSAQVKQLQQALIAAGYKIAAGATGFYGPQTKAALDQWKAKLPGGGTKVKSDPNQLGTDDEYEAAVVNNPLNAAAIKRGNTSEMLQYAATSGDLSGLINEYGQPFSDADQKAALQQGMEDNRLFYEAQQANEKAKAESTLAQKQADYQDKLIKSGEEFQSDRSAINQQAVNQGVLFSGGNAQRQAKLKSAYDQSQASSLASYGRDVGTTARDYQYQYGNAAAGGLSQYYNANANTYGLDSARGTVGSSGLSNLYNPSQYNFQGTQNVARLAAANQRAAGYLANKGNKLLSTSYNNQL